MKKKNKLILGRRRNTIRRDIQRRIQYNIFEIIKKINPFIYKYHKHIIKNKCILTGRNISIHRKFKLSRIMIKELGDNLNLPGIRKNG